MNTAIPHVHHHYHHVKTNKVAARLISGLILSMLAYGIFFSEPHRALHHSKAKISAGIGHSLFDDLYTWGSSCLASYAKILNVLVSVFGWKKSFLWFWYIHVGWGSFIYFGIPIFAVALLVFILKRENLALPILLILYMWHHGLSFAISHYETWSLTFCCLLGATGLILLTNLLVIKKKLYSNQAERSSN